LIFGSFHDRLEEGLKGRNLAGPECPDRDESGKIPELKKG
jgi:hypothetical protein